MKRKQVSENEFLSPPSDSASFPHIRSITPPLSLALSSASASPPATPAALTDTAATDGRGIYSLPSQHATIDVQAVAWPSDYCRDSTTHRDSFTSSQGRSNQTQARAPIFRHLSTEPDSPESLVITNEILLSGSRRMAIRSFALDQPSPCEDVKLYRSVARSPLTCTEVSDTDDGLSALDLARMLSSDEEVSDEQDERMSKPTDITSARLQSFKPDKDEARVFRWASGYFLACILQGRMQFNLANAATASATRIFERMLMSDSRFILSGLSLMATVLNVHGRNDMLKKFLLDSRHSIEQFFRMKDHPLSAPYAYLLSMIDDEPIDDEAWETTLRDAHTKIHLAWNGGPNAMVSHYYWAWHILKCKRYADAIENLKICYKTASEMYGRCHIITVNCMATIARARSELDMYDDAVLGLQDALKRAQWALGVEHPFCYTLIERLGDIYQKLGKVTTAEETFREVVEGRKKSLGVDHTHTLLAMHKLTEVRKAREEWEEFRTPEI
jgi:tetratricopeptide (TPR) repeat protein